MNIFLACISALLLGALAITLVAFSHYIAKMRAEIPPCITLSPKHTVRLSTAAFDHVDYPVGKIPELEMISEEVLDEISAYTIPAALQYVSNDAFPEDKKDIRKRYTTVLAALFGLEIPANLYMLDGGAKKLYDNLLYTMQSVNPYSLLREQHGEVEGAEPFESGCPQWEHVGLLNAPVTRHTKAARYSLWKRYYEPLEFYVVQTLLQQTTAMILPLYPEFEKRLRRNLHRKVHTIYSKDEYRVVITAVAMKLGIFIPRSYFLYTPLTAILVETPRQSPSTQLLHVLKENNE